MYKKKTNSPGNRAVFYARSASSDMASSSIHLQVSEMYKFAHARNWQIVGVFIEVGVSGMRKERPQLQALLDVTKRKGCDIILVYELSRLSRSVYHSFEIFEQLGEAQIGLSSVKEPEFDLIDPSKLLFLTAGGAFSKSLRKSRHVQKK